MSGRERILRSGFLGLGFRVVGFAFVLGLPLHIEKATTQMS